MNVKFRCLLLCLLAAFSSFSIFAQNLTVRQIMAEPSIAGTRPDAEKLSPDGKLVVYSWNAEGKEPSNLYIVDSSGKNSRILVNAEQNFEARQTTPESKLNYGLIVRDDFVKAREKNLGGVEFSPDSKRILFLQNSDIYVLDLTAKNAQPRRVTRTQGFEGSARWLDNDRIVYSSSGNYFVLNLNETSLVQVTKEANPQAFTSIFNVNPTRDGKMFAYVVSDGARQRALFVPNYLDEFVQANSTRRGFTDQKVFVTMADGSLEKPFEIKLPKADGAGYIRSLNWAADNASLLVDRIDQDLKRRQLFYVFNAGRKDENTILVTEETDAKWIGGPSRTVEPNPKDNSQVLFTSERDGNNHLYLATLERRSPATDSNDAKRQENPANSGFSNNVTLKQLTAGKFEVDWAKWSGDGAQIVFSSTEDNTAERKFYALVNGKKVLIGAGSGGMRINGQISTSGERPILLYEFSKWNQPSDLFTQEVCTNCRGILPENQITNSTPAAFEQIKWNQPQFIDIPARDGKVIKSKIYAPSAFDKTKKYPMVIFVHGAGYLQNTINGWNNYYREFMFNQILTQKGYVVLDIDYRGSAGYGRDWRTEVYDFLGGKDYEDHLDAIDYAVKNYAVDPQKIGVYGGSYGGFMAEMLAFRTDKITCAAALRPVADWKNYYASSPVYTAERLGFPDKNPDGYKRSSPIAYAENLNKPLLILHGLVDDNVPVQDSMQLVEKLIRLGKTDYFEEMIYPSESHGFVRPTSWTDEYTRILNFFEKNLK